MNNKLERLYRLKQSLHKTIHDRDNDEQVQVSGHFLHSLDQTMDAVLETFSSAHVDEPVGITATPSAAQRISELVEREKILRNVILSLLYITENSVDKQDPEVIAKGRAALRGPKKDTPPIQQGLIEVIVGPCDRIQAENMAEKVQKIFDNLWPEMGAAVTVQFSIESSMADLRKGLVARGFTVGRNPYGAYDTVAATLFIIDDLVETCSLATGVDHSAGS